MKKRLLKAGTGILLAVLDICFLKVKTCAQPTIVVTKKIQSRVNQGTDSSLMHTTTSSGGFFALGIDISKLSAGIYTIELALFEGTISTHKIVPYRQVMQKRGY